MITLSDRTAYEQLIGSLMHNTLLLLEYNDINPSNDIDDKLVRICYIVIRNLYVQGATAVTPIELDKEITKNPASLGTKLYMTNDQGLNFIKICYEFADVNNFEIYYTRIKKWSLLRRLYKEHYDISAYCLTDDKIGQDFISEQERQANFDNSSIEDILNAIEGKYNEIRNEYLSGGRLQGDPSQGLDELLEELQSNPNMGPELEGIIFSSICRGAREGCLYLRSASTSAGKSRSAIFDACRLAYPERYDTNLKCFVKDFESDGLTEREARKVLFIVTEMDKSELQTIMLAYLSKVNEEHILTSKYEFDEYDRVLYAVQIMKKYAGYFLIEEVSEPNLINVEATIKKYATLNNVKYIFFDYLHSTASMIGQFSRNNLREDTILMLMANQLKQIAKDYKVFIASATQVNSGAMGDDGSFKNEMNIRGAKSIADFNF